METRLVHFASILKMATGFRVTKERVIKSTFDVKKKNNKKHAAFAVGSQKTRVNQVFNYNSGFKGCIN